jgi:hypothetical protein
MNTLYQIYFLLPNFSFLGKVGKGINYIMAKCLKLFFDYYMPRYLQHTATEAGMGINTNSNSGEEKYIVSLTSFPARINDIWLCIETILRQNYKPDMIILWLAEEQFPERILPRNLLKLQERGLIIKYCDDLKSHKKYYYTLQEYPNANIITLDDDSYYPENVIENLIKLHEESANSICANRAHKITYTSTGEIKSYRKWLHNYKKILKPSHILVPTGVGGVLYPANSLDPRILNKEVLKNICFQADDLWLKVHAYLNGSMVVTSKKYNKDLIAVSKTQNEKLLSKNSYGGGNDEQLKNILDYYNIKFKVS